MGKPLTKEERELWYKFKTPNCNNLQRKKVNQPSLSAANTWEHEEQKLKKAFSCLKKGHKWLMEAEEIKTKRIRDFVCLTERIIIEWERNKTQYENKNKQGAYESPNCIVDIKKLWE